MDRCIIRCIVGLEHCYFVTDVTKDACVLRAVRQFTTCLADRSKFDTSTGSQDVVPNHVKNSH